MPKLHTRSVTRMMGAALGALLLAPSPALADAAVNAAVKADYDAYLGGLFTHFHRNPELSFLETETAKRMAAELQKGRRRGHDRCRRHRVVGVMRNGAGPTLLVRADMDGLPLPGEERPALCFDGHAEGQ